ncbi:hypothetical protein BDV93DRAFT_607151 [Ceratobasidium sp. AG-I]|nr:hypothetical protein BDV93DRAFT_607151 [Ceratobasidium sp. AG-I]
MTSDYTSITCGRQEIMPFVYSDGNSHLPTQSKFAAFASSAFDKYFDVLGALISATAALFPHKHPGGMMDMPGSFPGMPVCVCSTHSLGSASFLMVGANADADVAPTAREDSKTVQADLTSMAQTTKAAPLVKDNSSIVQNTPGGVPDAFNHHEVVEHMSTIGNDHADGTRPMGIESSDPGSLAIDTIAVAIAPLLQAKLLRTVEELDSGGQDRQTAYGKIVESIKMPALKPLRLKLGASTSKLKGRKFMSAFRTRDLGSPSTPEFEVKDAPTLLVSHNDSGVLPSPTTATTPEDSLSVTPIPQLQGHFIFKRSSIARADLVNPSEDIGYSSEMIECDFSVGTGVDSVCPVDVGLGNPASLTMGPTPVPVASLLKTMFFKTTDELISGEENRQAANKMVSDTVKLPPLRPLRLKSGASTSKPSGCGVQVLCATDTLASVSISELQSAPRPPVLQGEREIPPSSTAAATFDKDVSLVMPTREPRGSSALHRRSHVHHRQRIDTSVTITLDKVHSRAAGPSTCESSLKRRGHINCPLLNRTRAGSDGPTSRQHRIPASAPPVSRILVGPSGKLVNRTSIVDWLGQFGAGDIDFVDPTFIDRFSPIRQVAPSSPFSSPETTPPVTPTLSPVLFDEDSKAAVFGLLQHSVVELALEPSHSGVAVYCVDGTSNIP